MRKTNAYQRAARQRTGRQSAARYLVGNADLALMSSTQVRARLKHSLIGDRKALERYRRYIADHRAIEATYKPVEYRGFEKN